MPIALDPSTQLPPRWDRNTAPALTGGCSDVNGQLTSREATTAIPGIAAIGGVIATGSKGSAAAVPGSTTVSGSFRCRLRVEPV